MDSAPLRPTPDSGTWRQGCALPRALTPHQEPGAASAKGACRQPVAQPEVTGPRIQSSRHQIAEAWAAAKAEIRGRGGRQWSNFRPPAALGPEGQAGRLGHAGSRWSQAGHQGRGGTVDFLLALGLQAQKRQPAGRAGSGVAGHEGLLWLKRAQVITPLLRATEPCNSVDGSVTQSPRPCQA